MEQDGGLPYGHMPDIVNTTTAQAYHTEEERAHPDEAQRPPCSMHAPYAILVCALVKQRNRTASGKAGFVAVKMLDVVLTQLPAVIIAIARIKIGKPQAFDFHPQFFDRGSPPLQHFIDLRLETAHFPWVFRRL